MQTPKMETETCPCSVCRSDMGYIYPCESPVVIIPTMEINDVPALPVPTEVSA